MGRMMLDRLRADAGPEDSKGRTSGCDAHTWENYEGLHVRVMFCPDVSGLMTTLQ